MVMPANAKRKINFLKIELKSSRKFLVGIGGHCDQGRPQIKIEIRIFWRCGPPESLSARSQMSLI